MSMVKQLITVNTKLSGFWLKKQKPEIHNNNQQNKNKKNYATYHSIKLQAEAFAGDYRAGYPAFESLLSGKIIEDTQSSPYHGSTVRFIGNRY
jgi:competence protein ComGC